MLLQGSYHLFEKESIGLISKIEMTIIFILYVQKKTLSTIISIILESLQACFQISITIHHCSITLFICCLAVFLFEFIFLIFQYLQFSLLVIINFLLDNSDTCDTNDSDDTCSFSIRTQSVRSFRDGSAHFSLVLIEDGNYKF